jgi:hypothetical protein
MVFANPLKIAIPTGLVLVRELLKIDQRHFRDLAPLVL